MPLRVTWVWVPPLSDCSPAVLPCNDVPSGAGFDRRYALSVINTAPSRTASTRFHRLLAAVPDDGVSTAHPAAIVHYTASADGITQLEAVAEVDDSVAVTIS